MISRRIIDWQKQHGRHDLPWQQNRTPYRVWVAEIMLQQTQTTTVIPYFLRFMDRFSDIDSLAVANIDEVLFLWTGLGYYSRARNLHRTARQIVFRLHGQFPQTQDQLQQLPGIGRSTAAAILSQAMQKPTAILDANVKRVLCRFYKVDQPVQLSQTLQQLWRYSEQVTANVKPQHSIAYTQGIMDLGALICQRRNPHCHICPIAQDCAARQANCQQQLPVKVKSKQKPVKQQVFAWATCDQHLLLQQRPSRGIWGGLWSLPDDAEFKKNAYQ